jgi:hypothetical protein
MLVLEAGGEYRVDPVCAMTRRFIYAVLISAAAAAPGFAQTTATPYSVTNRGVVALGTNNTTALTPTTTGVTANPAAPAQSASATTTGTTGTALGPTPGTATGAASGAGNASTLTIKYVTTKCLTRGLPSKFGRVTGERNRHGIKQRSDLAAVPAIGCLGNGALCCRDQPLLRPLTVASCGRPPRRR